MAAEARSRIKRHKAERLGFGGVDYFPDINAHGRVDEFQLVDHCNVHAAKDIFQQLGCLRDPAGGDWDKFGHSPAVNRHCLLKARRGIPANHFRDQLKRAARVPRIFPFRRKGEVEILTRFLVPNLLRAHRASPRPWSLDKLWTQELSAFSKAGSSQLEVRRLAWNSEFEVRRLGLFLRSSIFHLQSSIFYLRSSISHLPSPNRPPPI